MDDLDIELLLLADADRFHREVKEADLDEFTRRVLERLDIDPQAGRQ